MDNPFVLIISVVLYIAVIGLIGLLMLSSAFRQKIRDNASRAQQSLKNLHHKSGNNAERISHELSSRGKQQITATGKTLYRNRWLLGVALMLLLVPVLVVFILRGQMGFEAYEEADTDSNRLVASLLRGEQLVPPPPLPPEAFQTREVEQVRPLLAFASRDWGSMDKDFEQRLLLVFKLMEERHGYKMVLLEGYRSPQRQEQLAKIGGHVTNARAYQSYHQFGLAADCAFLREGKVVISERDPWAMRGYQLYGEVAESIGLVWGGRWKMMDLGHIEWRKSGIVLGKPPKTPIASEPD